MKLKTRKIVLCVIITLALTISSIVNLTNENKIETNSKPLSNKKIGWGIRNAKNHSQPDIGNKDLIEKYNGLAIGNNQKKYIYLTFDMGYEAGYTKKILDSLKKANVTATFFITAHYFNTSSDLVKRMIDEGHIVGNHTVNHKSMPSLSDEELKKELMTLHQSIYNKLGYEMKYTRPPKGEFSERTLALTEKLGYKNVMWSFAYVDWDENKQPTNEEAIEKITSNFHNGEIMLLHATSKTNSEILFEIIEKAKNEGYEFKSLEEFEK